MGFPGGSDGKKPTYNQEIGVQFLGREDPLEKGMENHSNILAWIKPWTLCGKERRLCFSFAAIPLLSISLRTQHQAILQPSRCYLDFTCNLTHFWGHLHGVSIRTPDHTGWGLSPSRLPSPQLQDPLQRVFYHLCFWMTGSDHWSKFFHAHTFISLSSSHKPPIFRTHIIHTSNINILFILPSRLLFFLSNDY